MLFRLQLQQTFAQNLRVGRMVFELAKKDLQVRYLGSYLGMLWAFIQPVIGILIYWFVFQIGFKSRPVSNVPFILWFVPAVICWNFVSDALTTSTNSIIESSYLVKKLVFPVALLPIIKIASSLFIHLFFIGFLIVMYMLYGYGISIYELQTVYYLFATVAFLIGISSVTSSLGVFLRDVGQFVVMTMQFGFWLTPIFWSPLTIPHRFQWIAKLNPMYYLVQGYRDSFIYHSWFWEHPNLTIYFWTVTIVLVVGGKYFMYKLRPHFADIL